MKYEKHQTPVLIQESKKCLSLKVLDEDYYNVEIKFKDKILPKEKVLFVKRRVLKEIEFSNFQGNPLYNNSQLTFILDKEISKDKKSYSGQGTYLKLAESISNDQIVLEKKDLLFIFSMEESKVTEVVRKGDFSYVKNHFDKINVKFDSLKRYLQIPDIHIIKKDDLIQAYNQLLKEDRTELYPLYLAINYTYHNPNLFVRFN